MIARIAVTLIALVAIVMPAVGQSSQLLNPRDAVEKPPPRGTAVTPAAGRGASSRPVVGQSTLGVVSFEPDPTETTAAAPTPFGEALTGFDPGRGSDMMWFNTDYLLGWIRGVHVPALVTTSPIGTPKLSAGILGGPFTSVVIGDQPLNGDARSGFKVGMGCWLLADKTIGADIGFFMTECRSNPFFVSSDGAPILARPFLASTNNKKLPSAALVAFPGTSAGSVGVSLNSGQFYGAHFELHESLIDNQHFRLKTLIGYRFLRFDDGLEIVQTLTPLDNSFPAGTRLDSRDAFATHNEFHGGSVGFQTDILYNSWSLTFLSKVAVGNLERQVNISGSTVINSPGTAPAVSSGGLLALASNIGRHGETDWVAAPEIGVNLGYDVTSYLRLRVGYSLLFLFDVARAADQVDLSVNPNLFPPANTGTTPFTPAFNLQQSNIWLQTINVGAEFTF